jgi:hypothetical protein
MADDTLTSAEDATLDGELDRVFSAASAPEPDPAASTAGAPSAEPAPAEGSQPRDDAGRFAPKSADTAPAVAEPALQEPQAKPSESPAPQAEPTPEPAPDLQAQIDALPAFQYRADGEPVEIPGSKVGPDGAFIPKAAFLDLQRTLSAGRLYPKRHQEWRRETDAANEEAAAQKDAWEFVIGFFDKKAAEGGLVDWAQKAELEYPILREQAQARYWERKAKAAEKGLSSVTQQQQAALLRPQMDAALEGALQEFGTGLDAGDVKELFDTLRRPDYEAALFPTAPEDMPEYGIRKGERIINRQLVRDEAERLRRIVGRYKPNGQPTASPAETKAAAHNAAVQAGAKKQPPPTVGATRGPAPSGKPVTRPVFTNTEDADEYYFGRGFNPDTD